MHLSLGGHEASVFNGIKLLPCHLGWEWRYMSHNGRGYLGSVPNLGCGPDMVLQTKTGFTGNLHTERSGLTGGHPLCTRRFTGNRIVDQSISSQMSSKVEPFPSVRQRASAASGRLQITWRKCIGSPDQYVLSGGCMYWAEVVEELDCGATPERDGSILKHQRAT